MNIVVIGANGQVASEVALLLGAQPGLTLRPIVRTRGGSAFLRYNGIRVSHGSVTEPGAARRLLAGADVIANFALAGGTPAATRAGNDGIVTSIFEHAPAAAVIVCFSTLAVGGAYSETGAARKSAYGDVKLRGERLVARLAKAQSRKAYSLRLGHVAGDLQGITQLIRQDVLAPPCFIPDPERHSNTTYTATIADALMAIAEGRAGPPGEYDLVNVPQWSWRRLYEREAMRIGALLSIESGPARSGAPRTGMPRRTLLAAARRIANKETLERLAPLLPQRAYDQFKMAHYLGNARSEIAALAPRRKVSTDAMYWPGLPIREMPGLLSTDEALAKLPYTGNAVGDRWPPDLEI